MAVSTRSLSLVVVETSGALLESPDIAALCMKLNREATTWSVEGVYHGHPARGTHEPARAAVASPT